MNKYLKLVRDFHDAFSFPQATQGVNTRLSEMDIILRQALLMEEGALLLRAIKSGDMVKILTGMANLAYCALGAIAAQGAEVVDQPVSWRHDGSVISLMRLFSDKINHCASGNPDNYSEVYDVCAYLAGNFINADFDKAFQMIHDAKMSGAGKSAANTQDILKSTFFKAPDLSECLYE